MVIGAPSATVGSNQGQGAAYVYVKPASGWTNSSNGREISASDGAANDGFGVSSAISGATVVVGGPAGNAPGEAYVYGR